MQVLYTVLMTCPWIPSEARCLKLTRNQPSSEVTLNGFAVRRRSKSMKYLHQLWYYNWLKVKYYWVVFFRQLSKQYFQTVLNWAPVWKLLENVPQNTCWRIVFISLMGLGLIPLFQFQFPFNQFRFQFPVWREWILIGINPNPDP